MADVYVPLTAPKKGGGGKQKAKIIIIHNNVTGENPPELIATQLARKLGDPWISSLVCSRTGLLEDEALSRVVSGTSRLNAALELAHACRPTFVPHSKWPGSLREVVAFGFPKWFGPKDLAGLISLFFLRCQCSAGFEL